MSDTDDVIEEIHEDDANSSKNKQNHFEGIFAFLNDDDNTQVAQEPKREIPDPYFLDFASLPESTKSALDPSQLSAFYQKSQKYQSFIFGPLAMDADSDSFRGSFLIPNDAFNAIKSGLKAVLYCIFKDTPAWPVYFSANINRHDFSLPESHFTPSSQLYYIDVTNVLYKNKNTIHISIKSNISGIYIFCIRLFFAPRDIDFYIEINNRPHLTLEDFLSIFHSDHTKEEGVESNSFLLSLICPLSLKKLTKPVRGISCKHLLCFDLIFYLRFTRECGKWKCPVCDNECPYEDLRLDQYVTDILNTVPQNCESVEVDEKGNFKPVHFATDSGDDLDDDD